MALATMMVMAIMTLTMKVTAMLKICTRMDNIILDISQFTREVDVLGINPDNIKINPKKHVMIDSRPLKNLPKTFLKNAFSRGKR